tara:strand:+ start:5751 stop:8117 length:2367 start_codon:yes stop_codon:yes gene_type:complete
VYQKIKVTLLACATAFILSACGGGGGGGSSSGGGSGGGGGSSNTPPSFTSATSFTFNENELVEFYLTISDPDSTTVTITVLPDGDFDWFDFDLSSGLVRARNGSFDFEQPVDNNMDNVYEQQLELSDGVNTVRATIRVTINDVDEPPEFEDAAPVELNENQTGIIFTAVATDPEGVAPTSNYQITTISKSGEVVDSDRLLAAFEIDPDTGELSVVIPFDYEAEENDSPISIGLSAEAGGLVGEGGLQVNLIDIPAKVIEGVATAGDTDLQGLGARVVEIADIDGDGLSEVWVTKDLPEAFPTNVPEPVPTAYLIWGKAFNDELMVDGLWEDVIDQLSADQAIKFTYEPYAAFGAKRSALHAQSLPDYDGDGITDLAIGFSELRELDDVEDTIDGPVLSIISGQSLTTLGTGEFDLTAIGNDGVYVGGLSRREAVGLDLATGDFDGDGIGDILFTGDQSVNARLIFGSTLQTVNAGDEYDFSAALSGDTVSFEANGGSIIYPFSGRVAALSDVTGDGMDEAVLLTQDVESQIHIIPSSTIASVRSAPAMTVNVFGSDVLTLLKDVGQVTDLVTGGDIDGDGLSELALAHIGFNASETVTTLVFGSAISNYFTLAQPISIKGDDPASFIDIVLTGQIASQTSDPVDTPSVSFVTLPGTGAQTLLYGLPEDSGGTNLEKTGVYYLFKPDLFLNATSSAVTLDYDALSPNDLMRMIGIEQEAYTGGNGFMADLDGDGIEELIFASPRSGPKVNLSTAPVGSLFAIPGATLADEIANGTLNYPLSDSVANETP